VGQDNKMGYQIFTTALYCYSFLATNLYYYSDRFHKMHNKLGYGEPGEHPEVQQFMAHFLKSPLSNTLATH
jgi:hypothetical protein